ncbi:hypothetical protein ACFQER_08490 [Halomicroarcula sp. GCM10025894]|uniref:hypothetical protein n=1 Tax=Halomicroarcula sp. GCM10025894 TaxID=3252673 RepID=UPI00360D9B52
MSCYEQSVAGAPVADDTILACEIDGDQRFYDIGVSTIENSTGRTPGSSSSPATSPRNAASAASSRSAPPSSNARTNA